MLWLQRTIAVLSLAVVPSLSLQLRTHDASFTPDFVLSVTSQNISVGGMYKEATLVNNSLPGPTLRIPEQKTIWIRVYNNIKDDNVTMVRNHRPYPPYILRGANNPASTGMVLPRPHSPSQMAPLWLASGQFHQAISSTTNSRRQKAQQGHITITLMSDSKPARPAAPLLLKTAVQLPTKRMVSASSSYKSTGINQTRTLKNTSNQRQCSGPANRTAGS